jgi:hypothetical protein
VKYYDDNDVDDATVIKSYLSYTLKLILYYFYYRSMVKLAHVGVVARNIPNEISYLLYTAPETQEYLQASKQRNVYVPVDSRANCVQTPNLTEQHGKYTK